LFSIFDILSLQFRKEQDSICFTVQNMILLILSLVSLHGQYFSDSGKNATKSEDQVGVMYEMHRVLTPLHPLL